MLCRPRGLAGCAVDEFAGRSASRFEGDEPGMGRVRVTGGRPTVGSPPVGVDSSIEGGPRRTEDPGCAERPRAPGAASPGNSFGAVRLGNSAGAPGESPAGGATAPSLARVELGAVMPGMARTGRLAAAGGAAGRVVGAGSATDGGVAGARSAGGRSIGGLNGGGSSAATAPTAQTAQAINPSAADVRRMSAPFDDACVLPTHPVFSARSIPAMHTFPDLTIPPAIRLPLASRQPATAEDQPRSTALHGLLFFSVIQYTAHA
jgi:hypothetical protein